MSAITFTKATKQQLKARIALDGPTGAGKTWTALETARVLGQRVVMIDTERGSGALYSDHFDFDYYRFDPPYEPAKLVEVLRAAEAEGYEVVIVDSLSHFWEGEGGTLDMVDAAAQRSSSGNTFAGWKVGTPALRHLIDTILGIDAHVLVTMRSKMEYVLESNDRGKQVPRKVGMAPVMRSGVEFEFTLVGDMDLEHRITITKSRCSALADVVIQPNRAAEMAMTFKAWLDAGEAMISREQSAAITEALNGIEDPDSRKAAKAQFVDVYDVPDRLTAKQAAEALTFARELAGAPAAAIEPEQSPPEPEPEADSKTRVSGPRATEEQIARLEAAIYEIADDDARSACSREIRALFGEKAPLMASTQIEGAINLALEWPGVRAPSAPEPQQKRGKPRSAKLRGLLVTARGASLGESDVAALASFLDGTLEPRPVDDIADESVGPIESLIADLREGRLTIDRTGHVPVVRELTTAGNE